MTLTRRELVKLLGGAALAFKAGCRSSTPGGDGVFADDELDMLRAFADVVIPPDDTPGGSDLGAVAYIETLVLAFDNVSPPIFAGGPFSDRNPFPDANGRASTNFPDNEFANVIELDRIAAAAWQLRVLGSDRAAVTPNEDLYGSVASIEQQLKDGLREAIDLAGKPVSQLEPDDIQILFEGRSDEFKALVIQLVCEAAFSAPEYGGNPDGAGWKLVNFEGDSQPLGYSQFVAGSYVERPEAPLSTPNPGPDPDPISPDVHDLLHTVIAVLAGRES
ncbi:MAG TPA: gluconate 2-dehydrogenase subunit 3 family protein [Kofleriaceae bacterium]|nr:gluconate 2-dehydrogenase subunit 3 family protein [Kofleriaceae bacterium]